MCKSDPTPVYSPSGDPAIKNVSAQIEKDPKNHSLYYSRAKLYYDIGMYAPAIEDLNKAISLDSTNADYHHLTADCYLEDGQSKKAIEALNRLLIQQPDRIPTLLKLSEYYLILKQYNDSFKTLDKVLKKDPTNAEAFFMMGMNLKESGDTTRAINAFQSATENDPELVDAWINLGNLYAIKNSPKAMQFYDNAIRVDSSNTNSLYCKAYYLQSKKNYDEALAAYQHIIDIDPHFNDAYFNSGIIYLQKDSLKKAYDNFNIATKNDPQLTVAYYYRAQSLELMGKKDEARKDYEQVLKMDPNFVRASAALNSLN
ncbi:MAG: tetratricopeptide repeat protein [Saprospiraceae bacterium]|nr:tetratricopeptide repeat protein [Saprospiraceae bacterium]